MARRWWLVAGALALSIACDDNPGTDAGPGMDAGPDEDAATDTDGGAMDLAIPGLDGEVEVIIDDRGMPHIYATTVHDLMVVEGYLMSRDRFIQMEFLRRNTLGRLAEVFAALDPSLANTDIDQRFFAFERQGQAIYDSLPADDLTRQVAEAFVEGINYYIDSVVMQDDYFPPRGLDAFNAALVSPNFGHWRPADIFALARFQAWNLSYDAGADVNNTRALLGVRDAFDPADADERIAARAGVFGDFWSVVQARRTYTREGWNDGTTHAFVPPFGIPAPAHPLRDFSIESVEGGARFFDRLQANPWMHRNPHYGSNSWVVHGSTTASGNAILSNDPHLALYAPPVWWYVHLNTERMGGERSLDAQGIAFAGLPGVVLGYNRNLAWSATTTGYDVTDVYAEEVTFRNDGDASTPNWTPVSVTFMGADVDLVPLDEEILVSGGETQHFTIYQVPHHGRIIPDSYVTPEMTDPPNGAMATGSGMSVRYTGDDVSNELAFFVGLLEASTVQEGFDAAQVFEVGAQNFSFADSTGAIGWTTHARIPQRACNFWLDAQGVPVIDPSSDLPAAPPFVLPGTGDYEWGDDLDTRFVPHDQNPARGYIATANQDNVGVTDDGDPCNDGHYIGAGFAVGYRHGRIVQRLDELMTRGDITPEDMMGLQHETRSSLGEGMRDAFLASLDHALGDTSDDAALAAVVSGAGGTTGLSDVRDRLAAWTFATPHGVGATDANVIADSVATTIFNVMVAHLSQLTFDDEETRIGRGMGSSETGRLLEWMLDTPAEQMALPLHTFRASYMGVTDWNDSVLWDDLGTDTLLETRDERVTRAALMALEWLTTELGADRDAWRWGQLHALRFQQLVPAAIDSGVVSIPPRGDASLPYGYPRDGDYGAVDVLNYSLTNPNGIRSATNSGARGGPSQRLVVEMTADGPQPRNSLPGGQSEDPDSPHHADEAALWIANEQPMLYFQQADIDAHVESTMRFVPGT
ncbi:MAG: penicillin acylase family protein [Myxococcales bacterium]|nr:penicillin acylase family protein [Myxococcales bacterium]